MQPRCKNLGAKGSTEARQLEVALALVTRHLGSVRVLPNSPCLFPSLSRWC